jgi:hypothetical protein
MSKGGVNIDPIKRFHEIASPDSIDSMCNIYEVYRAMLYMLGEKISDATIKGFSEAAAHTSSSDRYNYRKSIERQQIWRREFEKVKKIQAKYENDVKLANKIKEKEAREARLAELEEEKLSSVCTFLRPIGWPILSERSGDEVNDDGSNNEMEVLASGLPRLNLVMQVDIMGNFQFEREQSFQSSIGDLPARATFELTNMLYKTTTLAGANENLPR